MRIRKTQAERREESEQALLIAASEILIELGYNAATFERISERAGYSSSLVTSRFGSRDGLFRAIIEFLRVRLEGYISAALAPSATGKEKITRFSAAFMAHLEEDSLARAYYVLLAAAVANRLPQSGYFLEQHATIAARVSDLICDGQKDGSISTAISPSLAAMGVGCLQLGIATQLLIDPDMPLKDLRWVLLRYESAL
jgi:AcrR family transcriptional regulator